MSYEENLKKLQIICKLVCDPIIKQGSIINMK